MNRKQDSSLAFRVSQALPDKRIIKLSKKQIESLKKVSSVALAVIAAAGVISIAAVAPNAFHALNLFLPKKNRYRSWSRGEKIRKVEETFYYLKRSGLVRFKKSGKDWLLSLTELGKKRLPQLDLASLAVPKPKRWDGKWWLIAADIPTKDYRRGADLLRRKLKDIGLYSLQRTLWLYPFDPRKQVEFVSQTFGIARFVTVMKVEQLEIEDEVKLKSHFRKLDIL